MSERFLDVTQKVFFGPNRNPKNAHLPDLTPREWAGLLPLVGNDAAMLVAFFEARRGRLYGFRFKDWADYKSCLPSAAPTATDQMIGTGDAKVAQKVAEWRKAQTQKVLEKDRKLQEKLK